MGRKYILVWPAVFLCVAGVLSASCGSTSPTSPTVAASTTASTNPNAVGHLSVTVNPNPVPFSGKPITDVAGCANRNNTWYYQQVLTESAGAAITVNSEIDMFDGFVVNNLTGLNIQVPANGSMTLSPRWCSAESKAHTAQSTFGGVDANGHQVAVTGPTVDLMAAPAS